MQGKLSYYARWAMLVASGAVVFQTTGCSPVLEFLQTGFLAFIAGVTFFLARNV